MTSTTDPIIFVVDDDADSGQAMGDLVRTFGHQVQVLAGPREFLEALAAFDDFGVQQCGCVITDLRMGGIDGMEVLHRLIDRDVALPVIIVTAHAETAVTVRALREGAIAVLDKPFREDELWSFIQEALAKSAEAIGRNLRRRELAERFARLAPPDRQVLQLILEGSRNRAMATRLDISLRTVENRRRRILDTMQAESVAELARIVCEFEHKLPPTTPGDASWIALPFERIA